MTDRANTPTFTLLEKVTATRAILSVIKRVQDTHPQLKLRDIASAVKGAIYKRLQTLLTAKKDLTDAQRDALRSLKTAEVILADVIEMMIDESTTRELTPEEVEALTYVRDQAVAKRQAAAALRKAEKEKNEPATVKKSKPAKADAAQPSLLKA